MRDFRVVVAMLGVTYFIPNLLQSADYTPQEEMNLSIIETEQLLEVALSPACCESVSPDLLTAMELGEIEKTAAIQFESLPTEGEIGYPADQWTQHNIANVFFKRAPLSESREYQPKVVCSSTGSQVWFDECYEDSYIRAKAEWMERPIRVEGEVSDNDVELLYAAVDSARLVSRTDGQIVTSDKIYSIINYEHAANRVNVYVTTARDGYTDVVYLREEYDAHESARFVVSDFRCGVD